MPRKTAAFVRTLQLILDKLSVEKTKKDTQKALGDATDPKAAKQNLGAVGLAMQGLKSVALQVAAAVAAVFSVQALSRFANEFDAALSRIRRATGDTGVALKQLGTDLTEVFRDNDEDIGTVAETMSVLRRQTGLLGEPLQRLTSLVLDFADVTGGDAASSAEQLGQLLNRLGLEAEHAEGLLDRLTVASQRTGVPIAMLAEGLLRGSDALETLGLSVNQQIALLAQIEKQGGDVTRVATALNTALVRFAKEGATDGAEAFRALMQEIRDAPSDIEAAQIAAEIFGTRMGSSFAADVRAGRFEIEELTGALDDADGALRRTAEESETWGEKLRQAGNDLKADLLPALRFVGNLAVATTTVLARLVGKIFDFSAAIVGLVNLAALGFQALQLKASIALRSIFRLSTEEHEKALAGIKAEIDIVGKTIEELLNPSEIEEQGAAVTDAFNEVTRGAQSAARQTAEEAKKLADERLKFLIEAHELGIATTEETNQLKAVHDAIAFTIERGNLGLEERIKLTRALHDIERAAPSLRPRDLFRRADTQMDRLLQEGIPSLLPDDRRVTAPGLSIPSSEDMQGLKDDWLDSHRELQSVAENAAFGVAAAWQDAFSIIGDESAGLSGVVEALFKGIAGAGLGALAQWAGSEVAKHVALAFGEKALAASTAANPFTAWMAPGHLAAAKVHGLAALKWSVVAGGAAAAQAGLASVGGASGRSGGFSSGSRDPAGRITDRLSPQQNITIIQYIDGVDPKNGSHQVKIGEANLQFQQRTGQKLTDGSMRR